MSDVIQITIKADGDTIAAVLPQPTVIGTSGGGSVSDATTSSKGVVQLAGDLAGTAAAPTVPGLAAKVPATRTVAGHALSSDVTISAADVAADPAGAAATEATRATAAEGALASSITTETTARQAADTTNANAIAAEATTRANADTTNAAAITTETARAEAVEAAKADTSALTAEATARSNADAAEAIARDAAIATAVAGLINGAPGALDTLKELADAINDDASFAASVTTALAGKQPLDSDLTAIAALTTTAFGRAFLTMADAAATKTALSLVKGDVGLGNVDNTADTAKVLAESQVTGLVADLAAKAPLASPALTGNPTAPTATAGDNDTSIATTGFVTTAIATQHTADNGAYEPLWLGKADSNGWHKARLLMSTYDTNPSSTDHTTAIQNALNDAATMIGNGASAVDIVCDSRDVYVIGGAVQTGAHGELAQIVLPYSTAVSGMVRFVGKPLPWNPYIGWGGANPTVFRSTLGSAPTFAAATGIASIFGGPASHATNNAPPTRSHIDFGLENIVIRQATPVIAGVDGGWLNGLELKGTVVFDTDQMAAFPGGASYTISSITVCTAPQAIPVILPFIGCFRGAKVDSLACAGWIGGPEIGEYLDARTIWVSYTGGAALYVDTSYLMNKIGVLGDFNNAYGVAGYDPTSATPIAPTAAGLGSKLTKSSLGSIVKIGNWQIQRNGNAPAGCSRVDDLLDSNNLIPIEADVSQNQGGAGGLIVGGLSLRGAGGSLTGNLAHARIRDMLLTLKVNQTSPVTFPASTVAVRNPYFRMAYVTITGGTVTDIKVNNASTGQTSGFVVLPPNATISITYSVAPSWKWSTD